MARLLDSVDLFRTALDLLGAGRPFAMVTVLRADGSTPVKAGARAIVEGDGRIHGTVGGGSVEVEAQRRGRLTISTGEADILDFNLSGLDVDDASPICGGSMRLLVDASPSASQADYREAVEALARRERGVWLTTLCHSAALEVRSRFVSEKDLDAEARPLESEALRSCLAGETSETFVLPAGQRRESIEVFAEPLIPRPVLLIVGGGHIGQAVAAQACLVGFDIVAIDDRPEFTDAALFPPGTRTVCGDAAKELAAFPVQGDTFIVIVTRGHQSDASALRASLRRPAAYLGMIGSRRKIPILRREFLDRGWATGAELDRLYAPIGLDIGAATVPEIATSIVAQLIAVRRKHDIR
jgi:xanthine dehydrogenase accessory factor